MPQVVRADGDLQTIRGASNGVVAAVLHARVEDERVERFTGGAPRARRTRERRPTREVTLGGSKLAQDDAGVGVSDAVDGVAGLRFGAAGEGDVVAEGGELGGAVGRCGVGAGDDHDLADALGGPGGSLGGDVRVGEGRGGVLGECWGRNAGLDIAAAAAAAASAPNSAERRGRGLTSRSASREARATTRGRRAHGGRRSTRPRRAQAREAARKARTETLIVAVGVREVATRGVPHRSRPSTRHYRPPHVRSHADPRLPIQRTTRNQFRPAARHVARRNSMSAHRLFRTRRGG